MARLACRSRPFLGTFVEIQSDDEGAIEAAFEAIARVHSLMSAHEEASDVSRINRFAHLAPVEVDFWTGCVLERAIFWSKHSEGAFDVVRAGRNAIECAYLPRKEGQPHPIASHWTWLVLEGRAVRLLKPGCIDLGGIAKGFAVDKALEAMRSAGASSGLVNAGGDMAGFGDPSWTISIVHPATRQQIAEVQLEDQALATSALLPGGEKQHLPKCLPDIISASVLAPHAIDADALTKVILTGSTLATHCLNLAGAQGLIVTAEGLVHPIERLAA